MFTFTREYFLRSGRPIQFFQSLDMSDTGAGSIVLSPEFAFVKDDPGVILVWSR